MLNNAGDIYNELYYIYKNKYNKKNSLDTKNSIKLDYKKLRLADIYDYPSDKEQEEEQKETKTDIDEFSKYIAEKEKDLSEELFKKYFVFQKPSDIKIL